jgi:CDP-diacylglycerol--glycerol-3-phosphate 3-phosphatidyltransferase
MKSHTKGLIRHGLIPDWLDRLFFKSVTPLIKLFSAKRINPNWLTASGFLLNVLSSFFIWYGQFIVAGIIIGFAGIFDFIDGKVASLTGRVTKFGAIFDSILDRYSEILVFFTISLYFIRENFEITAFVSMLALIGSVMTSYVKAIGESHGFKFRAGALRRQERITLLFFGLIFTFAHQAIEKTLLPVASLFDSSNHLPLMPLSLVIYFLAIFTNFSAVQRFIQLGKVSKKSERASN